MASQKKDDEDSFLLLQQRIAMDMICREKYDTARELLQDLCCQRSKSWWSLEDPRILTIEHFLAVCKFRTGDIADAFEDATRILEIRQRILGAKDKATVETMHLLATIEETMLNGIDSDDS